MEHFHCLSLTKFPTERSRNILRSKARIRPWKRVHIFEPFRLFPCRSRAVPGSPPPPPLGTDQGFPIDGYISLWKAARVVMILRSDSAVTGGQAARCGSEDQCEDRGENHQGRGWQGGRRQLSVSPLVGLCGCDQILKGGGVQETNLMSYAHRLWKGQTASEMIFVSSPFGWEHCSYLFLICNLVLHS